MYFFSRLDILFSQVINLFEASDGPDQNKAYHLFYFLSFSVLLLIHSLYFCWFFFSLSFYFRFAFHLFCFDPSAIFPITGLYFFSLWPRPRVRMLLLRLLSPLHLLYDAVVVCAIVAAAAGSLVVTITLSLTACCWCCHCWCCCHDRWFTCCY